jgi:1,4-dihydroxy-6-naphthoate synthase
MQLTLGISPCPNDTFIFDALVNGRLDTGDLRLEVVHEDVETLNRWALAGRLDVTKLSFGVLPEVAGAYALLESGGALGRGVGPLLVARPGAAFDPVHGSVAIPGERTTAHLLFSLVHPGCTDRRFMVFSGIEAAVARGEVDAGVIIHESRFTYAARGLVKLLDLGEAWERRTGAPIPLGGIVARRALGGEVLRRLDGLVRASVEAALAAGGGLSPYVKRHAQALEEAVMRQHIELYVNQHSVALGPEGRRAVETLLAVHAGLHGRRPLALAEVLAPHLLEAR